MERITSDMPRLEQRTKPGDLTEKYNDAGFINFYILHHKKSLK